MLTREDNETGIEHGGRPHTPAEDALNGTMMAVELEIEAC
jgi:hypothetical protein